MKKTVLHWRCFRHPILTPVLAMIAVLVISQQSPVEAATTVERADLEFSIHNEDGNATNKLVVGHEYEVRVKVPKRLQSVVKNQHFVLEASSTGAPENWNAHKKFKLGKKSKSKNTFTVPISMLHNHYFRLRTFPKDGEGADTSFTSTPLMTTIDYLVNIQLINDSKHDLIFNVPLGGTMSGEVDTNLYPVSNTVTGQLETVPVRVNVGKTVTLKYTNPGLGTSFGWVVNRADCFLNCDNFVVNWAHTPNNNYTACVDQIPKLNSGQNHYVRVTPRTLSASMDLFIWGDQDPLCTAGLDNGWGNFWDNHPKLTRFAEVTAGVAAVSLIVLTFPEEVIAEDAVLLGPGNPAGIEGFMEAQLVAQGMDQEGIEFAKTMFREWLRPFF